MDGNDANSNTGAPPTSPAAVDVAALRAYTGPVPRVFLMPFDGDDLLDVTEGAVLIVPNG